MRTDTSNRIALLFLAAGASRRMGRDKALLPWTGKTVIAHHFQTLEKTTGFDPWIIMKPDDHALTAELDRIGWLADQRTVNPAAPDCEMLASIVCGISATLKHPANYPTLGIALVDQVLIRPETFQCLETAAALNRNRILQPEFEGKRGHPVLLPRPIAEELVHFSGESLRNFLGLHADSRSPVAVDDEGILKDMDTPEAYKIQLSET